jgi:hypothetical protein
MRYRIFKIKKMRQGPNKRQKTAAAAGPSIFSYNTILYTLCVDHLSPLSFSMLMRASPAARRCRSRAFNWLTMEAFTMVRLQRELTRYYGGNERVAEIICSHLLVVRDSPSFLTGGFLAAVLNGDNVLQCGNVDILIDNNQLYPALDPFYLDLFYGSVGRFIRPPPYNVLENLVSNIDTRAISSGEREIRFMRVKNGWPVGACVQSFDLPFCKNYLGQGKLQCTHTSVTAMLTRSYVVNLKKTYKIPIYDPFMAEILHDNRAFSSHRVCEAIYHRLKKYTTKGYDIYVEEDGGTEEEKDDQWSKFWKQRFDSNTKKLKVL